MFLLARTMRGRLTAQVWVASSEGPASFIEIIDVLAKVNNNKMIIIIIIIIINIIESSGSVFS